MAGWLGAGVGVLLLAATTACSASGGGTGGGGGSGATSSGGVGAGQTGGGGGTSGSGGSSTGGGSANAAIGDPCQLDEDCTDPPDAECFTTIGGGPVPSVTFPGGYCSKGCDPNESDQCGTTGGCVSSSVSGGQGSVNLTICASSCANDDECRKSEGYRCTQIIPGFGFCAPG